MIDHLMTIFAVLESIVILVLAEPVLNRMSPCARSPMRLSVHAIAMGSAIRLFHLADGHDSLVGHRCCRFGGFAALLLCHQIGNLWCEDRRKNRATIAARRTLLEDDARTSEMRKPPVGGFLVNQSHFFKASADSLADVPVAELCRSIKARVVQVNVDALCRPSSHVAGARPDGRSNSSSVETARAACVDLQVCAGIPHAHEGSRVDPSRVTVPSTTALPGRYWCKAASCRRESTVSFMRRRPRTNRFQLVAVRPRTPPSRQSRHFAKRQVLCIFPTVRPGSWFDPSKISSCVISSPWNGYHAVVLRHEIRTRGLIATNRFRRSAGTTRQGRGIALR